MKLNIKIINYFNKMKKHNNKMKKHNYKMKIC